MATSRRWSTNRSTTRTDEWRLGAGLRGKSRRQEAGGDPTRRAYAAGQTASQGGKATTAGGSGWRPRSVGGAGSDMAAT